VTLRRLILCVAVSAVFYSAIPVYASEIGDWQQAVKFNTVYAYNMFLEKHPGSRFAAEARQRVEQIQFDDAIREGRISSYEGFLEKYPGSSNAEEVKRRLAPKLALLRATPVKTAFVATGWAQLREALAKRLGEIGLSMAASEGDADVTVTIGVIIAKMRRPDSGLQSLCSPVFVDERPTADNRNKFGDVRVVGGVWTGSICEDTPQLRTPQDAEQAKRALIAKIASDVANLIPKYFGSSAERANPRD